MQTGKSTHWKNDQDILQTCSCIASHCTPKFLDRKTYQALTFCLEMFFFLFYFSAAHRPFFPKCIILHTKTHVLFFSFLFIEACHFAFLACHSSGNLFSFWHTHTHTYTRAHTCMHTRAHKHAFSFDCETCASTHTHKHPPTQTYKLAHTQTVTQICTHPHTHTPTHSHTYTHTLFCWRVTVTRLTKWASFCSLRWLRHNAQRSERSCQNGEGLPQSSRYKCMGSRSYHAKTKSTPACLHSRGAREKSGILNLNTPIF